MHGGLEKEDKSSCTSAGEKRNGGLESSVLPKVGEVLASSGTPDKETVLTKPFIKGGEMRKPFDLVGWTRGVVDSDF
ncbi:hypothetical protein AVEN_73215-1 [Araneus ventricosus]|uniref:Uncharacterized protein n=1 Tax=Araneus ventricosus TaxID=182803 RepID=A0A4Y2HN92_ARAVE|nr:hypothetical protein AVEN_73215-1 [Araneus ventricosus]